MHSSFWRGQTASLVIQPKNVGKASPFLSLETAAWSLCGTVSAMIKPRAVLMDCAAAVHRAGLEPLAQCLELKTLYLHLGLAQIAWWSDDGFRREH